MDAKLARLNMSVDLVLCIPQSPLWIMVSNDKFGAKSVRGPAVGQCNCVFKIGHPAML